MIPDKFYCGTRIYNTSRSERILDYKLGQTDITLYKNIKSNEYDDYEWFYVCLENGHYSANYIDRKYVKNIFINRNRDDLCRKHGFWDDESDYGYSKPPAS